MIRDKDTLFSKRKQCELLSLNRAGLYYKPTTISSEDLQLMRAIDEEYLKHPFYGRRRMTFAMRSKGFLIGSKKIRSMMKHMGLEAIYPKPNLSKPNKMHKKYPYLLKQVIINRPNQVWAGDITYIPMPKGFGYLFAIIDWYSRYVISWELSNLLDTDFCIQALQTGFIKEKPEIFNTDQGVQFTSIQFTEELKKNGVQISMDGKGRAFDNIFIERLWRSVKYEDIYPKDYENLLEVQEGLKEYFNFYNKERPHQSLDYRTPEDVYQNK